MRTWVTLMKGELTVGAGVRGWLSPPLDVRGSKSPSHPQRKGDKQERTQEHDQTSAFSRHLRPSSELTSFRGSTHVTFTSSVYVSGRNDDHYRLGWNKTRRGRNKGELELNSSFLLLFPSLPQRRTGRTTITVKTSVVRASLAQVKEVPPQIKRATRTAKMNDELLLRRRFVFFVSRSPGQRKRDDQLFAYRTSWRRNQSSPSILLSSSSGRFVGSSARGRGGREEVEGEEEERGGPNAREAAS